jgi:DNA-binding NarL/FixJ family response regulator
MRTETMIRVWIVEDNANFRNAVIQEINETEDLCCDQNFGCCEALLQALATEAPPNAIVLDIRLPGLSGLEAISTVKKISPDSEILMLTMFDDQDRIFRALCAGASGYLLKTANADIPAAIREAVTGGAPLSPAIARSVLSLFSRLGPAPEDYRLSPRERSVLELMVQGMIKKEIADQLQLSYHTVDDYLRKIYKKLHVNNASGAVAKAVRERLC